MGRRALLLIAALLLAAIGTGVLFVFLQATTKSASGPTTSAGRTRVLVPEAAVPAGTKIDASVRFTFVSVDAPSARAARMLTDAKALQGLVANQLLPALVPVTAGQFGGAVQETTGLLLPKGSMALTVELSDPNKVSTFLRKGSKVAIFVLDPDPAPQGKAHEARLILPQVTVLTIGTSVTIVPRSTATAGAGSTSRPTNQSLVTLQVTQDEAGKLLVAQQAGDLYFTLLGPETSPTPGSYDQTDIAVG